MGDDLLERLVGTWVLTGTMGEATLAQHVEAKSVLQGRFLQVHCVDKDRECAEQPGYEAIYLIGYDRRQNKYVMHLLDTFGAGYSRTLGIGDRRGDTVEFLFDYPDGRFSNTFT